MRMQWGVKGIDPKGKRFFIDVVADSKSGAMARSVLCKGYGTLITSIVGPVPVNKTVRRQGAAPCEHQS